MRIWKVTKLFISFVLILTLVFQFPLSTLATALETGSVSLQPIEGETVDTSLIQKESAESEIVAEIESKRTEYSKEYLLSNGLHMAAVYADAVHYETEDGWQDIDNTLKLEGTGTSRVYANTAGVWDVQLPYQLTKNNAVTITKDGYTLSFALAGELRTSNELQMQRTRLNDQAETFSTTAVKESAAQIVPIENKETDALTLEKIQSRLQYTNVFHNTNIVYDLQNNRLKESIVIDSYSSTLRGYRYTLNTGEMIPVLTESGRIDLYDKTGETIVMCMPAPFLKDEANAYSFDVQVTLTQSGNQYILTYLLPQQWLASEERSWPVILDPVVNADTKLSNLKDQTVCSKKQLDPEWGMVQAGYYPSEGITRFFVKYVELPALSSADVVVHAEISMYLLEDFNDSLQVEVHKVNGVWEENTITWGNMPGTDNTIEDFQMVQSHDYYYWNVTDIVQDWYQGENTGMMFKMSDAVEAAQVTEFRQFLSSEYSTYRPSLSIVFRNNNGLESYWDYTSASAGRAGTAYVNNYTGNLVWVRDDIGFSGNRMPVSISHIYNANDRIDINSEANNADANSGNTFGLGYGWRTNYNQLVYRWSEDSNYYVWEDADGTDHYFYYGSTGTYKDEDGLELTLTTTGSSSQKYKIADKYGNASYFDSPGRLTKIENYQEEKSSINITYINSYEKKISTITDGAGRVYNFTYTNDLLTRISYVGKTTEEISYISYEYEGGQLTEITNQDGKSTVYTYDTSHRMMSAQDIDGYKLLFQYTTTVAGQPSRISQVAEKAGNLDGGVLTFAYANNQTSITDHNGNTNIFQFNNWGNTVSVQDSEGRAQYAQYALGDSTDDSNTDATKKGNQLRVSSKLQNTVGNRLWDSGFENSNLWSTMGSATQSIASGVAYLGNRSLKVVGTASELTDGVRGTSLTVAPGESYTFSAYVKSTAGASAKLKFTGATGAIAPSDTLSGATEWTRLEISYTNTGNTAVTVSPGLVASGTVYMDCVQLEKAAAASRYNLVENGDFRHVSYGWTYTSLSGADGIISTSPAAPAVELGSAALKITGDVTTNKGAYQTLPISGSVGDTFVLAGWAKGNAAPLTEGSGRDFGLKATLTYTNGGTKEFTASFNPDSEAWQYTAIPIVAEENYSSIKVELVYNKNVNKVYFDGIQLFKETFGQSYTYDEEGNVISIIDLQKQTTTYEYANNNLTKILEDNKAKMRYEYDEYHNVIKAITQRQDADGNTVDGTVYEFAYDDYGNNIAVSISDGTYTISSAAGYSTDGNCLLWTDDALGNRTEYSYNANTNLLEWVQYPNDSENTRTEYEYDSMFRTASVACVTDTELHMSADYTYREDQLAYIETPSTTYDFTYTEFSQLMIVSIGGRDLASYHYTNDANRYLFSMEYGNGDHIDYEYDNLGRLIQETYEDGDTVIYRYDNDGALAQVIDSGSGITTKYYYDFTGRTVKYTESGTGYSHSVSYEYDTRNNLTNLVENINGVERTTSYTYDDDNRVTAVDNDGISTHYYYDEFGRVERQETRQNGTLVLAEDYVYNETGPYETTMQIQTHTIVADNYDIAYTYFYDAEGNISSFIDYCHYTGYEYDSQNQLIYEISEEADQERTWTYDAAGNIISSTFIPYWQSEDLEETEYTYTYGNNEWGDWLTAYNGRVITRDNIGNPLSDGIWNYTWEHGRQLASMTDGTTTWNYTYDVNGMRTQRTNGQTEYTYVYDGGLLSFMTTDDHTLYFTYDAAGKPMTVTLDGTVYYYLTNIQGDVIAILDASGNRVVAYLYDAWGNPVSLTGSMASTLGALNPLRYRGYVYDTETGFYLTGTRYYDPEIGRFINADGQINDDILGTNLFAYCGNNPVTRADDTGRGWWVVAGALIGGIAGGVTKIVSNVTTGKKWNEGVIGATVGGAVYGGVLAATGNVWAAGFASAAAESLTNEVVSYIPKVSQANGQTVTKKVTTGNVIDSTKTVLNDTAVNGTISAVTGKIAGKIVPTNNGWFKPQKFVSSFAGKYAIKSELQTLTQSSLLFGVEGLKYSFNQRLKQGQQPVVTFFPDTEIRAAG